MFCMNRIDSCEHVLCTWVHCLTAFNNVVCSKFTENLVHSFSDRNCDKSHIFHRNFFLLSSLLCCEFLCITNQLLLMFLSHIVNLHTRQLSISECFLNCKTRIICVHMDFHNLIICNTYNRISDRFQISFKFHLICLCKMLFCHDDKFCAITKLNMCSCILADSCHSSITSCGNRAIIYLFAKKCIISTL